MGASSHPATISGSWLSTPYPFITAIERGPLPSTLERDEGDPCCLINWTTMFLSFGAVFCLFFFPYSSLFQLLLIHQALLFDNRISVAAWDALYDYDGGRSPARAIVGDDAVHLLLSSSPFTYIYHVSLLRQCISITAHASDNSYNIYCSRTSVFV